MKKFYVAALMLAAVPTMAHAGDKNAARCEVRSADVPAYTAAAGDVATGNHLEFARAFSGHGRFELDVCHAAVSIESLPGLDQIKVAVTINGSDAAATRVQGLKVDADQAIVRMNFRKQDHATVKISLPLLNNSQDEINISQGDLELKATHSAGDRKIDVDKGHVVLLLNGREDYAQLDARLEEGTVKDERGGPQNGFLESVKDFSGHGAGKLQVKVGSGSLTIRKQ